MANPNNPHRLVDRFLALSGIGKIQADKDTAMLDADLDTRERVEITVEELVARNEQLDCRGQNLVDETLRTRGLRFTFNYAGVTPQILARWFALYTGGYSGSSTTANNEVQTLTRSGTVSGGTFKLSLVLEGRTVTTKNIPFDATTAQIQTALTDPNMLFIQPGDIAVTGTWGGGMVITFQNRMGHFDVPLMTVVNNVTGGGSVVNAQTTAGNPQLPATFPIDLTDSDKVRFGFVLGWENVTDRFEKYNGAVVDSFQITANRRQQVQLTVTVICPWPPDVLTSFTVPDCTTFTPLVTDDCRVEINSLWETTDVNTLSINLNDNVPTDESSAYGFDSVDIQDLERADRPTYTFNAGIFGSETDEIYTYAFNERTQAPVPAVYFFGMPGNRFQITVPNSKLKFQNNRLTFAGTLNKSVVNLVLTPYLRTSPGYNLLGACFIDQSHDFLQVSS